MPLAKNKYAASIANEKKHIFFVQATHAQGPAWYFVRVAPNKAAMFRKKLGTESFNVEEYGKILVSGWGISPTEALRKAIESGMN